MNRYPCLSPPIGCLPCPQGNRIWYRPSIHRTGQSDPPVHQKCGRGRARWSQPRGYFGGLQIVSCSSACCYRIRAQRRASTRRAKTAAIPILDQGHLLLPRTSRQVRTQSQTPPFDRHSTLARSDNMFGRNLASSGLGSYCLLAKNFPPGRELATCTVLEEYHPPSHNSARRCL